MKKKLYILMTLLCCLLLCVIFAACNNKNKACDHRHATAVDTVIGTSCEDGGVRTYTCPDCSKTWEEKVAKFEHNFVDDSEESHPATCTSPGELIQRCTRCNKMTSLPEQQLQHNYVKDEKNSHPADCITPGVVIEICSRCNDRKETTTPALGHKWEGTDCTGKVCSECEEKLPATKEHSYQIDDKKTEAATCTKDGETVYVCSECKDSYTVTVPKTGHDYQIVANSESGEYKLVDKSNCTYETSHRLKCKNCTDEKIETYTVENRHTYKTVITKEATCNAAGEKAVICSVCNHQNGEAETIATDENAHKWNGGEKVGNITTFTCELCRHTKKSIAAAENVTEVPVGKEDLLQADDVVVNNASIAFDETAKNSLPADKELTLGVTVANNAADIDSSLKDKLENDVYNITLSTGNDNITSFDGGKVTVRIPYTLAEGEDVDAIVIWYVDGGKLTNITGTYANGYVTFETEHFSYYTVGKYTPEEMCAIYGHHDLTRTKEATCTESGYSFTICTRCGVQEEETTYTPATGHNFETDVTSESKAPTCTANGVEVKKCTKCDAKFSTQLPATGHTWKEGKKVDATCEHSGSTAYSCENCDATYTITTPQRPHEYNSVKKEATCEEDGYTTYTCKYCQYSYKGDIISAFGHKWDRLEPTCGDPKKCTVCGKEGAPATGKHSYVNGVCSVCGEGCEHNWVKSGDVESTCRVPGYTLYKCSKCNTEKKDDYKELGDHNFGSDGRCTVCGTRDESAATNFYETLFKSLSAKKFTLKVNDDIVFKLKSIGYNGNEYIDTVTVKKGELYVNITDDGEILFTGEAIVKYDEYNKDQSSSDTYECSVMSDGKYLYIKLKENDSSDQYMRYDIREIPEPGATILSLIRDKEVVDYLKNILDTNKKDLLNLVTEIADALFERTQTANGYDVVFNNQVVLDFNEDLKNLSITQLIDKYFWEGAFDEIAESLRELTFDLTVADLIDKAYEIAAQYGIDKDTLFSLANAMYTKYLKQIFEGDSEEGGDFDVSDFIQGDFMSKTIAEIIEEEVGLNRGEFKKYFDFAVKYIKDDTSSVYALIADDVAADEFDEDFIYDLVKSAFDGDAIEIVLNTDKTGKIRSFGLSLNDLVIDAFDEHIELDGSFTLQWNESKEFVFDKNLDIPAGLFTYIREQCKKTGTYTYSEAGPTDNSRETRDITYLWELKDDILSLTVTQTSTYIYYTNATSNGGRIEEGNSNIDIYKLSNVEKWVECSRDCGDWIRYDLSDEQDQAHIYKSFDFTREYDKNGQLINNDEGQGYSYDSSYAYVSVYFDPVNKQISSNSQHTNIKIDEENSQTEEDVDCESDYKVYYICGVCGERVSTSYFWKSHDYEEYVELAEGSTYCTDGVIVTRKCTKCGDTETRTSKDHERVSEYKTYDLPAHGSFTGGQLIIRIDHCACGEYYDIYIEDETECAFGSDNNPQLLDNGHMLETYHCAYTGCTAYYTIERWTEPLDTCTRKDISIYKFYYAEGQQIDTGDIRVEGTWKSHNYKESVELLPGSKTCSDGAVMICECLDCGYRYVYYEYYYHRMVTDTETYDLPNDNKLHIDWMHCACGYNSSIRIYSDYCYFNFKDEQELGDGHLLQTYSCGDEDCTAFYTIDNWEVKIDDCTKDLYTCYKFYSSEGNQIGRAEGYTCVARFVDHINSEPTEIRKEYTLEEDGYTGFRVERSYNGCEHIEPYQIILEVRYDKFERPIYAYLENTSGASEFAFVGVLRIEIEYASDTSCDCTITYNNNGEEGTEQRTLHSFGNYIWENETCTQPGYRYRQCAICGETEIDDVRSPHGHIFSDGVCEECGLKAQQNTSGNIVLEDKTNYDEDDDVYTVGVWEQNYYGPGVEIQLSLVYLNDQGIEEEVTLDIDYTKVRLRDGNFSEYWYRVCYMITVDRAAVRAAVEAGKEFVGLRLTFIPVGDDNPQVIAITLEDPYFAEA